MNPKWIFSLISVLLFLSMVGCQGTKFTCKKSSDFSDSAEGGKITIAWDSNTESFLGGYKVYYGTSPNQYKACVDVGKVTESSPGTSQYTLIGLIKGKTYYIAVTAYAKDSFLNSGFSNEISGIAK